MKYNLNKLYKSCFEFIIAKKKLIYILTKHDKLLALIKNKQLNKLTTIRFRKLKLKLY